MGVLDKLLGLLKLNDDYDDDEFLDDDEDFDEDPAGGKKGFLKKTVKDTDDYADDFDDFDTDFDDEPIIRKTLNKDKKTVKTANVKPKAKTTPAVNSNAGKITSSKVSPIRTRKSMNDMSLCVVRPKTMEDSREITETLISNCTVVLNMEGIDVDLAQRIVDFTSGSIYALGGGLQRVSNTIFIVTPASVDISGDITDLLNGAFDIPSMNFNY